MKIKFDNLDNNDIKIKWVCDKCGKRLSMEEVTYHDIDETLCYECFLKYVLTKITYIQKEELKNESENDN